MAFFIRPDTHGAPLATAASGRPATRALRHGHKRRAPVAPLRRSAREAARGRQARARTSVAVGNELLLAERTLYRSPITCCFFFIREVCWRRRSRMVSSGRWSAAGDGRRCPSREAIARQGSRVGRGGRKRGGGSQKEQRSMLCNTTDDHAVQAPFPHKRIGSERTSSLSSAGRRTASVASRRVSASSGFHIQT